MSPRPTLRLTRASVFAGVCVTLATAGHAAVSHVMVAPSAIGLGFAAVLSVAWVLTETERSLATILGGLLGGQFVFHALFTAGHPGLSAMHHSGPPVLMTDGMTGGHGGTSMTLAHLTAAVVSAWWLRRGERAVWRLARRVAALAGRPLWARTALLDSAPVVPPARAFSRTSPPARPRSAALRNSVVRRGPPFRPTALARG
jgi:hypothetical protein